MNALIEFGPFSIDVREARLVRAGVPVPLAPKVFDLLVYLANNPGRLIEKEELLRALWPDSFVEEANLSVNVAALRRVLGTREDGGSWIETIPKRGYRFLGVVSSPGIAETEVIEPSPDTPPRPPRPWKKKAVVAIILAAVSGGLLLSLRNRLWFAPSSAGMSIAVLPFQEIANSGAEGLQLGLGMTDALITKLGAVRQLTVRPMASVTRYMGSVSDPIEAGRLLKVDTVVTGSIQRLDKRVRVTVRLLRVSDGHSLWADKYDEFATNIFAVQDSISEKLAQLLTLRLTSEEQEQIFRRYTESTEAFHLYELGRYARLQNLQAIDYFQRSIAADPNYALPYIELSGIYLGLSGNGLDSYEKYMPQARAAAAKALRLAPELAETHAAVADIKRFADRDFTGAQKEIAEALRLGPRSSRAHDSQAILLGVLGDLNGALAESRIAVNIDPFSPWSTDNLGWLLHCDRQDTAAVAWMDELENRSIGTRVQWNRFYAYLSLRRYPEAISLMQSHYEKDPARSRPVAAALAHGYALVGRKQEAVDLLQKISPNWGSYQRAVVEIVFGNSDRAIVLLNQAIDEHNVFAEWIKVDPDLDPVRSHPGYAQALRRFGLDAPVAAVGSNPAGAPK